MRRPIVLLTLLAAAAAQAVALQCPMAPLPAEAAPSTVHLHDHGAAATSESPGSHSAPAGEAGCRMVMACAGAVLAAPIDGMTRATPPLQGVRTPTDGHVWATTFPSHETPPPRLPV